MVSCGILTHASRILVVLSALVLCASASRADNTYVLPLATAIVKDRVYSTTIAIRNPTDHDVPCEFIYTKSHDPKTGTIRSRETIPAGKTQVHEDFLIEIGAVGTVRLVCADRIISAARIQSSRDDGKTFDEGRVFAGISENDSITKSKPRTIASDRDLVAVELFGKSAHFKVVVRNNGGVVFGEREYELPPHAQQIVNLSKILQKLSETHVDIVVIDGEIGLTKASRDPEIARMTRRLTPEARIAYNSHQRQVRVALATAADVKPSITEQLLICPFKGASFRDPRTGLCFMRGRWYDPNTGTFLTPDPEGYRDSSNLYAFGKGDPVNNSDPTGRLVKFTGKDPWGDFFLFRDSLHNPAAAALLTLQGDSRRGYFLGIRPGVTKAQFLATAIPDPSTYLSDLASQGIPPPKDRRTVEEKVFDMMSSMHVTEFETGNSLTRLSSWPFSWFPGTRNFQEKTMKYGGAMTLEPFETPSGNTAIAVNPDEINGGSAWAAVAAYNIDFDPQIATMHEFGHALAYHDNNLPCFQMWSVYFENQVRARRGERLFRTTERPLIKDPKTLLCP